MIITLEEYLMGREKLYPQEYIDSGVEANAISFLGQINSFFKSIGVDYIELRSGWRPREINKREGGKERSYHIIGKAIDISDHMHGLYRVIEINKEKLRANQLWLEHESATPTWVHLDCGVRRDRESRIFLP